MQTYHTTQERALRALTQEGFAYEPGERMGEGVYRHRDGRRAWIDEAGSRSFDSKGRYWFMLQVRTH